jgi:hypothetical protein
MSREKSGAHLLFILSLRIVFNPFRNRSEKSYRIFRVAFGVRLSAMGNQAVDHPSFHRHPLAIDLPDPARPAVRGGRKKLGFKVWLCSWQSLTVHCV